MQHWALANRLPSSAAPCISTAWQWSPYLQHQFCRHRAATCRRRRRQRRLRPSAQGPVAHLGPRLSACHANRPALGSRGSREGSCPRGCLGGQLPRLTAIQNCLASLPDALAAAGGAPRSASGRGVFVVTLVTAAVAGTHPDTHGTAVDPNKARGGRRCHSSRGASTGGPCLMSGRQGTRQARPVCSQGQLRLRTRSNSVNWIKATEGDELLPSSGQTSHADMPKTALALSICPANSSGGCCTLLQPLWHAHVHSQAALLLFSTSGHKSLVQQASAHKRVRSNSTANALCGREKKTLVVRVRGGSSRMHKRQIVGKLDARREVG